MIGPQFIGRNPAQILAERVTFDSAGYVYRGLSWLDYAKRHTSWCAFFYAALETRLAIEHLLFEELVMSVGGKLDRAEYEKAKGSSTRLAKLIRRLSPHYERLVSFTRVIVELDPNAPRLISWDHPRLLKHWSALSNYLHWAGEPLETLESPQWFVRGLEAVEQAASYLWQNMSSGYSGIMMPEKMQPEIRQAWEDYLAGCIDLESVRRRGQLAFPTLSTRSPT